MKLEKNKSKKINKIVFISLTILVLIISILFFNNNLLGWDHGGHLDSSKTILENSWPNPTTWNDNYFSGYPQNYFYPPLFSWIVATTGIFLEIELAYKLCSILIFILTIIVLYKLSKIFEENQNQLILFLLFLIILFLNDKIYYGSPIGLGGTMFSSFFIGLLPNALGLLLVLYFLYCIEKNKSLPHLSIIFALGMLSHYIFLVTILFVLIDFSKKNYKELLAIIIGLIISGFWWIPAIINFFIPKTSLIILPIFNLTTIVVMGGLIFYYFNKDKIINKKQLKYTKISILLYFLIIIFTLFGAPFQLYRMFLIIILLTTPLIFSQIKINLQKINNKKINNKKIYIIKNLIIITLLGLIFYLSTSIDFSTITKVNLNLDSLNELDYYVIGPTSNMESHHALFYEVVKKNGNVVKGLFVEQSQNSTFLSSLGKLINPNEFVWGVQWVNPNEIDKNNLMNLMYLFGIDGIITTEKISKDIKYIEKIEIGSQILKISEKKILWYAYDQKLIEKKIYLYKFIESPKIELLSYCPQSYIGKDWGNFSSTYLTKYSKIVLNETSPSCEIDKNAKITKINDSPVKLSFFVDSNKIIPILIRKSYFKNWAVYINGVKDKIYLATPNQMVIYGKGEIELVYENNLVEFISIIVSGIGIIFLIIFFIKKIH
ncbi:MAG TPA: hypothetical protein PKK60_00435 [archaeon]|mgnify:CR=1 FL=1|nr:hypothetical protein [archaeon]